MRYELLGSLRVVADGESSLMGSQKAEALLSALVIRSDHVVAADELMGEIWSGAPPARANAGLHVYVSGIRKFLTRCGCETSPIVTQTPGYMLCKGAAEFDYQWFLELVDLGRSYADENRCEEAAECCESALALWRGPVLGNIGAGPILRSFVTWMTETRAECEEMLVDAQLRLGRHREVVTRLHTLVAENPFRERLYGRLMLALYWSDRRADALRIYQRARRTLVTELGLEPGRSLQDMQQAILRGEALRLETVLARDRLPG